MKTHVSEVVDRLQSRFDELKHHVDASFGPQPVFQGNDQSQIYKAFFKTMILEDGALIAPAVALAAEQFPDGGLTQAYPMLHLPQDTSEQGNWHRDHDTHDRRVFWVPISRYAYPALSVVPNSEGMLSMPLSMAGSRGLPLVGFEQDLNIAPRTFYSWSSRMVHRGNLNTSNSIGSALVIFFDRGKSSAAFVREPKSMQAVCEVGETLKRAVDFDDAGNVRSIDATVRARLSKGTATQINGYFKIRTGRDLWPLAA